MGPSKARAFATTEETLYRLNEWTTVKGGYVPMTGTYSSIEHLHTNGHVPVGLVPVLERYAKHNGIAFEAQDHVKVEAVPSEPTTTKDGHPLHPHQVEAIRATLTSRLGIILAPTGSGKTAIATGIVATGPTMRWLVLVPGPDLVRQHLDTLKANGIEAEKAKIGGGSDARVVVATLTGCAKHLRALTPWLATFDGVIFDECHVIAAPTYLAVAKALVNAGRRYGLSATPLDRTDGRNLIVNAMVGCPIYTVPADALIEQELVARPVITLRRFWHKELGAIDAWARTKWATRYAKHVVRNRDRNQLVVNMVQEAAKPCVVFAKELEHVQVLHKAIEAAGINAVWVDGSTTTQQRASIVERVRAGYFDCIVSSKVFEVGVDIPEVASIVIASAGKSTISTIQRIGRGMRVTPTKKTFEVWDVFDLTYQALERQARERIKDYKDAGHEVAVTD